MKIKLFFYFSGLIILLSCREEPLAKPLGNVRLEYPKAIYKNFHEVNTPYSFDYNSFAILKNNEAKKHWYSIEYKKMNATVYLSYFSIQNNLKELLKDSEKLIDRHSIKASSSNDSRFENPKEKVYGLITRLGGETASNIQFHFTDSTEHYISGSLYFHAHPEPDSLRPAVDYIANDIKHFAETLNWN